MIWLLLLPGWLHSISSPHVLGVEQRAECVEWTHSSPQEIRRCSDAQRQLEYATLQKRHIRGTRGEGRRQARKGAVRAYRAVRLFFPRDSERVAEASFRAGELLRSGGEQDGAISEFEHAQRAGKTSAFRARAGMELGHIYRRARRTNEALECFEAVEALGEDFAEQRDMAAYWQGRVYAERGRSGDAKRCFKRAAQRGVQPLCRIRAFDAWANALVLEGDLEGAAGVLESCRQALAPKAGEQSSLGSRVRFALDGMRSPERLAIAVRERQRQRRG